MGAFRQNLYIFGVGTADVRWESRTGKWTIYTRSRHWVACFNFPLLYFFCMHYIFDFNTNSVYFMLLLFRSYIIHFLMNHSRSL